MCFGQYQIYTLKPKMLYKAIRHTDELERIGSISISVRLNGFHHYQYAYFIHIIEEGTFANRYNNKHAELKNTTDDIRNSQG